MDTARDASKDAPPEPASRVEFLYQSERARVTRLSLPDGPVIRKELRGPDRDKRLRHETAVLERLSGAAGVAQLAMSQPYPDSIMLTDVGGASLARWAVPLDVGTLTGLGLGLARAMAEMHRRGVVHRDICPANVLLRGAHDEACLVGFGLASMFAEVRAEFSHPSEIVGTLAYLAPEQTGRTGRPVDQRADLYALGATLYELATGAPPFGTGDPLRLTHDHLARVPEAPAVVNPAVPTGLSEVIMHLLEKEPDNRYQTADGLVHDLAYLRGARPVDENGRSADANGPSTGGSRRSVDVREGVARGGGSWRVGGHDYPLRLLPPSRVIGRDAEIAALDAAFTAALSGHCHGVLVSGSPGVGKTSLVNELRSIVTARDGWFVSGKFDQFRRDQEFDAGWQAFHGLGRLLLAEPEEKVADVRARMLRSLGPYAGLLAAMHPEFAVLLGVAADPTVGETGDPLVRQARLQSLAVDLLRIVASAKRPVVFVLDDLQWAGRTPLGLVDMVLADDSLEGLLLVGAFREVDAAHPLAAMLPGLQRAGTEHVRLGNLPPAGLAALLADMLRLDGQRASELASVIGPHTQGNPYETVELLNALRHDGVLVPGDGGWRWHAEALRRRLGRADVVDLLAGRADAMPAATRDLLEAMACLGGRVEPGLLQAATGMAATVVEQRLAPALDDGVLVSEAGSPQVVRFRHDRVQETLLARLGLSRVRGLRLQLARRLAEEPELFAAAAQQYLPVVDAVRESGERRRVVGLLRRAADQAQLTSNHAVVERCLSAAVGLIDAADSATLVEVHTGRLEALYSLGRLEEADEVYRTLDRLCSDPLQRMRGVLVQVSSLTNRRRRQEAVGLGVELLRQLGCQVPTREQLAVEIERGLDRLYQWIDDDDDDPHRPNITDPTLIATATLINRLIPPAWSGDRPMFIWLVLEARRIWSEHGPTRSLIGPLSRVAFVTVEERQDYWTGRKALRRIMAVGDARGYEPDTFQADFLYGLGTGHWFEPLERNLPRVEHAQARLFHVGDLQSACLSYLATTQQLLDYAPTLDSYLEEVESGLALARRTGNDLTDDLVRGFEALAHALRGEDGASAADDAASVGTNADNPPVVAIAHVTLALRAALLGDSALLDRHSAAMMPLLPAIEGFYLTATAHLLRALALAGQIRSAPTAEGAALLAELDGMIAWLASRAADAPANFLHLLRLAEAERAWASDDFRAAAYAFDVAQREAATRQRPWHRALILERAARFYLAYGMDHIGYTLLAAARREYHAWGAATKVNQLDWAYPALQSQPEGESIAGDLTAPRSGTTTAAIDLLGILAASQALSSATSIDALRDQVVAVLSAMTGATGVHLLLHKEDQHDWWLSTPGADGVNSDGGSGAIPVGQAGSRRLIPMSVFRYAERTREPLVVSDAVHDDRFARDPYLTSLECCSMLAVPIVNRGVLQALLLLENRLIRGAFSAERLDGVMLIAGQLAVSLDNALVYASLELKVAERTAELAQANQRLELLSITDPLTGLANRRRFQDVLTNEHRRAQRTHTPISLAIADIDHFKAYNDHYGHLAGDACLQHIATQLRRHIRDTDLIARYGGEEFAIIMPNTSSQSANHAAERLRTAITTLAETHPATADQIVTVSIGVATSTPTPDHTTNDLLNAADTELYNAKHGGRNRISPQPTDGP